MVSLADQQTERRFNLAFITLFSLIFLAAPSYYQDNQGGEGLFLPFNNIVWLLSCFLIGLGLLKILHTQNFRLSSMTLAMLFFLATTTLLGVVNSVTTPVAWFFRSLAIWGGVLYFIALAQFSLTPRWRENLLYIIMVSALIQGLYGLIQILAAEPFPSWLPQSPGVPRGIFQQQNLNASYAATGLIIALYLVTLPSWRSRHLAIRALTFVAAGVTTLTVVTAGSRIGILGAAIGVTVLLLCRYQYLWQRRYTLVLMAALVFASSHLGNQLPATTGGFSAGLNKFNTITEQGNIRLMIYDSSWQLFKEKPLLGYGIGQFESVWHAKKIDYLRQHPGAGILEPRLSHPHNELLYWALEGGLAAVAGIVIMVAAFLWSCLRLGWRRGGSYLALVTPIALHTQVELPFYISQLHWILFLTLLAIVAGHRVKTVPLRLSSMARVTGLALALALPVMYSVFVGHSLAAINTTMRFLTAQNKDVRSLESASKNLYFNRNVTLVQMQVLLQFGLESNDDRLLNQYVSMAKSHLRVIPDVRVFAGLSLALHRLQQYDDSHQVLARALAIYPTSRPMLTLRDKIMGLDREAGVFEKYWQSVPVKQPQ